MNAAIIGYGKMGREIERLLVERGHGVGLIVDADNRGDLDAAHLRGIDVALEFTTPATAYDNIRACIDAGTPVVSGTTGWTDRLDELKTRCKERGGAFFYASNYSLGVNLLPTASKLCSFDCIYCECGWNAEHPGGRRFNGRGEVRTQLEATLRQMVADGTPPDVITFAGNGEPTMHPDFEAVIGDTIALRDALCPAAKVSVLSNATQIHRDSVRRALLCLLRGVFHRLTLVLGLPFLLLLSVVPLQDTNRRAGYGVLLPRFRLLHGGTGLDVTHFAPPAWWSSGGTAPCRGAAH